MRDALILLAEGCEELEAVTVIDLLRRAGLDVISANLGPALQLTASRGVKLQADSLLDEVSNEAFRLLVLPGGQPGTDTLARDPRVEALLHRQQAANRLIAAICAAPKVLAMHGLLNGRRATAYPGTLKPDDWPEIQLIDQPVVIDNLIVTSRGPGAAIEFALTLIGMLAGNEVRDKVHAGLA